MDPNNTHASRSTLYPMPRPVRLRRLPLPPAWVMGVAIPAAIAAGAWLTAGDLFGGMAGGPLISTVVCLGAMRIGPLRAGIIAGVACLAIAFGVPLAAFGWISGAVAAGLTAGWLAHFPTDEDDHFFLPIVTALLIFLIVATVAVRGDWGAALDQAHQKALEMVAFTPDMWEDLINRSSDDFGQTLKTMGMDQFSAYLGWALFPVSTVLWVLATWLGARMIRLWAGRLKGSRGAMILFRMRQRYIFLLIAALVLAILYSLCGLELALCMALVLAAPVLAAGFIEGLGVMVYHLLAHRAAGSRLSVMFMAVAMILVVTQFPPAAMVLGLADVWFDFRRLDRFKAGPRSGSAS